MRRLPLALVVFVIGIAVSAGQILMLGPLLPAQVASHFGPNGQADGFMSRAAFLASQWGLTVFMTVVFLGMPALLRACPTELINLPNKEYWLSPERRAVSLAYLADRMYAFGAATFALLTAVFQMVYKANITGTFALGNGVWLLLLMYLAYTGIWITALVRRFSAPS